MQRKATPGDLVGKLLEGPGSKTSENRSGRPPKYSAQNRPKKSTFYLRTDTILLIEEIKLEILRETGQKVSRGAIVDGAIAMASTQSSRWSNKVEELEGRSSNPATSND